jgi:predicted DNA-binding transcriptional regulator AlpA
MAEHELILEPECRSLTRLHASTRRRLERAGKFPRSFKIGDPDALNGRKAWSRSEIMLWIAERKAARSRLSSSCQVPANAENRIDGGD